MADIDDTVTDDDKPIMDALFESKAPNRAANGATKPVEAAPEAELTPEDVQEPEETKPQGEAPGPVPEDIDDETVVAVVVDGEEHQVSLKDLKANYSADGASVKRYQEAAEQRNIAQQHASWLYEAYQAELPKLQNLEQIVARFAEPQVNWDWLRVNNPAEYAARREDQRQMQEQRAAVNREIVEIQKKQEFLDSQAMDRYIENEAELLRAKVPEFRRPDEAKALMADMAMTLDQYGFTRDELANIKDHRVFLALKDLARYNSLRARKAGSQPNAPSPSTTLRAGGAKSPVTTSSRAREAAIMKQVKDSGGHPDAVALTLFSPSRKRG